MASSAWKNTERETAKAIGGVRLLFAEAGGDAESARFVADAKRVRAYSLNQARLDLAKLAAAKPEKTPIVTHWDQPGRGGGPVQPLVVMRLADFARLVQELEGREL